MTLNKVKNHIFLSSMEQRRFIGCQTTDFRSSMYGTLTVYFVRTFSLPFFANSGQINIVLPQATQPSFFIRKSVPMRTFSRDLIKDALLRERKRKKLALGGIRTHSLLSFCARGVLQPLPFLYLRPTVAENSCSENYSKPNSKSSLNIATVYFVGYIFFYLRDLKPMVADNHVGALTSLYVLPNFGKNSIKP